MSPLRLGFLGVAHMHAYSYASCALRDESCAPAGVWDPVVTRAQSFADRFGLQILESADALLDGVDAVVIASENKRHAEFGAKAAAAGKAILCEKPLVTSETEAGVFQDALRRHPVPVMIAFPCRYSPAFIRARDQHRQGQLGPLLAICATNRGRCPFDWFVDPELSGGGAMIDHVVHVADLLRALLGDDPIRVQAQIGHNMYGQAWEDCAMLTLEYADGRFASLDSSWSRPQSYKTWGDVTMNLVYEKGVVELDLFNQHIDRFSNEGTSHVWAGYGSDLDGALLADFVAAVTTGGPTPITFEDGLAAARVAIAGYASVAAGGIPAEVKGSRN